MRSLSPAPPAENAASVAPAPAPPRPPAIDLHARVARVRAGARGLPRRLRPLADRPAGLIAGVLALMALTAFLRSRAIGAGFWIDEGISVGIASFPLAEIPTVLRQDGGPPLYYLLLSVWMDLFGDGEARTHALSLGFTILAVPAALWAGRSLFDTRTGWMAAIIAALHPFLTYYAQETRMYSLVALLTLLLGAVFVHAFVDRRRGYLPLFTVLLATLLYTHNWALFVGAGAVAALGPVWQASGDRRGLLRDAALAFGGAAVLYAPWVPSLVFQALSTGAPWATVPTFGQLAISVAVALGGLPSLVILLVGGAGFAAIFKARGDGDPARRRRWTAALALLVLAAGTVLTAWLASQVAPAWADRYMAVAVGPAILITAVGLAHAPRLGLAALALVAFLSFNPLSLVLEGKDNTREVTTSLEYRPVGQGDLVVSTHPERTPLLYYYLGEEFRYATPLGPVADPRVFDWRNALERLEDARPTATADPLIESLESGQALILVQPIIRTAPSWRAPWTALVRRRVAQWEEVLNTDPRLRRSEVLPEFGYKPPPLGVRTVTYRKR